MSVTVWFICKSTAAGVRSVTMPVGALVRDLREEIARQSSQENKILSDRKEPSDLLIKGPRDELLKTRDPIPTGTSREFPLLVTTSLQMEAERQRERHRLGRMKIFLLNRHGTAISQYKVPDLVQLPLTIQDFLNISSLGRNHEFGGRSYHLQVHRQFVVISYTLSTPIWRFVFLG